MRVNINISENDLRIIDVYCKSERYSRSQLLVLGALEFIQKNKTSDSEVKANIHNITQQDKQKGLHNNTQLHNSTQPDTILHNNTQSDKENIPPVQDIPVSPPKNIAGLKGKCEIKFPTPCNHSSIGKFKFNVFSDGEEKPIEKELCRLHKVKVQRESGSIEEI